MDSVKKYENNKQLGVVYTPPHIVDFMVFKAFKLLEKKEKILLKSKEEFVNSLLKIKILDPAVGTGRFIKGIIKKIHRELVCFKIDEKERNEIIRTFVSNNLFGIEIDTLSLNECKEKLRRDYPYLKDHDLSNLKVGNSLIESDVYDFIEVGKETNLLPFSWKEEFSSAKFDLIIGNPPYFSFRKIGLHNKEIRFLYAYLKKSPYWKKYFRSSADVYFYFLIKSLDHLNEKGLVSFILPNYWITNHFADKLREKILTKKIEELFDFKNHYLFRDKNEKVAISSCIISISNEMPSKSSFSVYILKNKKSSSDLFSFNVSKDFVHFLINQNDLSKEKWILTPNLSKLKILFDLAKEGSTLDSEAIVAQGVSPGVKKIFVLSKEEVEKRKIEKEVLYPFITNKSVKKWYLEESNLFTIFPKNIIDLNKFPFTSSYLREHKELLEKGSDRRKLIESAKIRWFDYSVYRNIDLFLSRKEKIITPYRSKEVSFAYDKNGLLGATDIYAIFPKNEKRLFYLLGILNSNVAQFWFSETGKKKGEMIEFFSRDLGKFPLPFPKNEKEITKLTKTILATFEKKQYSEILPLVNELNTIVLEEYNLPINFFD